jgi:HK97 family phage portal protein
MSRWHKIKSVAADLFAWGGGGTRAANEAGLSVTARSTSGRQLSPAEALAESIAVSAAVNAIANDHSSCTIRLFTHTGREIVGGPCYELFQRPCPMLRMSVARWLGDVSRWYNTFGELALDMGMMRDAGGRPTQLIPLSPEYLHVDRPTPGTIRSRADVQVWRYDHADGTKAYIRDDYLCHERMFNPNAKSVRGLSPLTTGMMAASTGVAAERYNKDFFDNGGIPSHLIVLPEGTSQRDREAFKRQYYAEYGTRRSNAHKVFVVAGSKDVKFESLEEPFQDGAFMEMQREITMKIAQLYHVPAIVMGIYDKTRFDSADQEREVYLEHTIEPQAKIIGEAFQTQIVEQYFRFSDITTTGGKKIQQFPRGVQKQFDKAQAERRGNIILIVDTDALPLKHKVIAAKTEQAKLIREAYGVSFKAVERWMDVDFGEDHKVRDEIFIKNDQVCISDPKLNEAILPGVKPEGGAGDKKPEANADSTAKPAKGVHTDPDALRVVERLVRKLRRPTYDAVEKGAMWSLAEADEIAADEALKPAVRKLRHGLRMAVRGAVDPVAASKKFLNSVKAESLL